MLLNSILPEASEILHILGEQSAVVCRILNDVLSMQKIEEGGLKLEKEEFDFEEMLEATLRSFEAPLHEKEIQLVFNSKSIQQQLAVAMNASLTNRVLCRGDKYRLRQVIGNNFQTTHRATTQRIVPNWLNLTHIDTGTGIRR